MNKHILMLSAVMAMLAAGPAFATCSGASPKVAGTIVNSALTAPIDTCTDGDITIQAVSPAGSVKISKASTAAVTINSANKVTNATTIQNNNATGAIGVLLDGTNAATGGYTIAGNALTNSGAINLTGSGNSKVGVELANGTFNTNILLNSSQSVITVSGDNSAGVAIESTGTLNGELNLAGTIAMTPTNANESTSVNISDVTIAGTVNGNVTADSSSIFTALGQNAQGIVVTGSINCAGGRASCTSGGDLGTLTNEGNIDLVGARVATGRTAPNSAPESGSAILVNGNVMGGIVNGGPLTPTDPTPTAVLSSSGIVRAGTVSAVLQIAPNAVTLAPITIGVDSTAHDAPGASVINRGTIFAEPLSPNDTVAVDITGLSSTATTTLTGSLFNAGTITAVTSSTNGPAGFNPSATAILIGSNASIPSIVISGESSSAGTAKGTVNANVSGQFGGQAQGIFIEAGATVPVIDITDATTAGGGPGKLTVSATTLDPGTVTLLKAVGIFDAGNSLKTINNAGLINVTVTTLTSDPTTPNFANFARAIDLSAQTTGGVTVNNAGVITGDVLMNGSDTASMVSVLNVGAGAATGATADQVNAASAAATATGKSNNSNTPAIETGSFVFGSGTYKLYINDFGSFTGAIVGANPLDIGTLDVGVAQHGSLDITNTAPNSAVVRDFDVFGTGAGAGAHLTITGSVTLAANGTLENVPTVLATNEATVAAGTNFSVTIGSIVPASVLAQTTTNLVLIQTPAGGLNVPDFPTYAAGIAQNLPFFFDPNKSFLICDNNCVGGHQLILQLTPKLPGPGTPGDPGLNLKGTALTMFEPAVNALLRDQPLGSAVANGIQDPTKSATNTPEQVFSQFAPDVSGDVRDIAILLTDSATGPVAARQRQLRMYANQPGDFTLWGQEFAEYFNNKGNNNGEISNFKDHGFGFSLGADGGDPDGGWYGGAFTFYSGDATQVAPENSKTQTDWYMASGYSDWRGHHLFLDAQASVAAGQFRGKRFLKLSNNVSCGVQGQACSREADSKRPGLLGALGATTGAQFTFGDFVLMPEISLDALSLREEGYTETGGGTGFDLKVNPYYANSMRTFLGADSRVDIDLGDFTLQPEGRLGYRFDFLNDPVKIHGAFASSPADTFSVTGPDPSRGNVVAGATLGASTDTWSVGANFDWVRGTNGSTTEEGTFSLLGRI